MPSCSLARRVASTVDREKKREDEEEYSPFLSSYKTNHSTTIFSLLSQFYYIPKNCSLSVEVHFFLLRPHYRRCRTLLLVTSNKLTMGN
jgi:hypothetical protein